MNEKEEEIQRIEMENKIVKKPKDFATVYTEVKESLAYEKSFHVVYMRLLWLIHTGRNMLPKSENELRFKAQKILADAKYYPSTREMNISAGFYRLGAGSTKLGQIIVNPVDLDKGVDEMDNQQAIKIVPHLWQIDSQIFQSLVDHKIVTIKKLDLKDEIKDDFKSDFKATIKEE